MSSKPDIIFFGGTFDPIHVGHMDAVRISQEAFPDARLVVVPSMAPPALATANKKVMTDFVDRVAMAVIAFDEWPRVEVSSVEEELPAPNYTYATLQALKTEHPGSHLAWMIGADQLEGFHHWKNPRIILELASLIVLPRPSLSRRIVIDSARELASKLGFSSAFDAHAGRLDLDGGGSIYVMEQTPQSESSTEIRALAARDIKKIEGKVARPVIDYIVDLELYQS